MKKRWTKYLSLLMAFVMTAMLTACGNPGNAANSAAGSGTQNGDTITLVCASADGSGGITDQGMQMFEKLLEERSNGRIDVQIYMDSLLGGEREIIEGVLLGSIQMTPASEGIYSYYDKQFAVLELPYLFSSYEAYDEACAGDVGDYLKDLFKQYGFTCYGLFSMGYRVLLNHKHKVRTPADMAGMKIRVPEVDSFVDCFKALGSNPTPMSWSEIYTGLQQRTIDGMECSPPAINDSRFQEVGKFVTTTNHSMSTGALVFSTAFLESLPEDLQAVVEEVSAEVQEWLRTAYVDNWSSVMDTWQENGEAEVTYLTDEEYQAFKDLVMPLYDSKLKAIYGAELIDMCFAHSN